MRRLLFVRPLTLGSLALLSGCTAESDGTPVVTMPVMSCARPDSLIEGSIRYSDEIHGTALSAGGTRAALLPDSTDWRFVVMPVASDFPDQPGLWGGNEEPETLTVVWRRVSEIRGVVVPRVLMLPRDTSSVPVDSIAFAATCQTMSLVLWGRGTPSDTMRLPRPGYWP